MKVRALAFLLIATFVTLILVMPAAAQPPRSLEFQGVPSEDLNLLKRKFPASAFSNPTPAELDEMIRYLFTLNHFEDIEVHYNESTGQYKLVGNPIRRISAIDVRGNSQMNDSDILKTLNIKEGDRPARKQILEAIEGLNKQYNQMGYLSTSVEISFTEQKGGQVGIVIDVREGSPCKITQISVDTSNKHLQKDLEKIIGNSKGQVLSQQTVDRVVERVRDYFVENKFLNAHLPAPEITFNDNRTQAQLKFSVENPYRFSLIFEGLKAYDDQSLVRQLNLKSGERLGFNPGAELADRIKQVYLREGYAMVQVSYDEKMFATDFRRQIRFNLKEGPRVRIKSFEITGRLSKDPEEYAEFIEEHSGEIVDRGYYNSEDLETGYKNLIVHLQNQGYLKAKIQSTRASFSKDGSQATVHIFLDEGPLTKIRNITFKGLTAFSSQKMTEVIGLNRGSPLQLNVLEQSLQRIQELYVSEGYLDFKLLNDENNLVKYSEDNTEATLEFEFLEGPKVFVASILIEGNEITKPEVFLKEVEFQPGDVLTADRIRDSTLRLQRLGLFSSVDIRTLEQGTSLSQRTVIITVSERSPGLFNVGSTVNVEVVPEHFYTSLKLYTGLAYRNLGGTARAISGRAEVTANFQLENFLENDLTLGYLEPFIFNDRIRGRINLNRNVRIFKIEEVPNSRKILGLETNQVSLLLDKDLTRNVKLTWNFWSLANTRKYSIRGDFPQEKLTIATLGPILEWDRRDHPFSPTRGFLYRADLEYSSPQMGSTETVHYLKASTGVSHYTPLGSPRWVWANSARGGYLKNLSHLIDGRVPEEVMFALGGRSTIRGFDQVRESIPSRAEFTSALNLASTSPLYVKTDSRFYLFKTALWFPIVGDLGGTVFYDGGAVLISGLDFHDPYRDAAGIGLRYNTPVGPVSIEAAWKLDRQDRILRDGQEIKESPFQIHFSIGVF